MLHHHHYYFPVSNSKLTKNFFFQVKKWKYVIYRKFDFSKYPEHFSTNLRICGWKPFIIRVRVLLFFYLVLDINKALNNFKMFQECIKHKEQNTCNLLNAFCDKNISKSLSFTKVRGKIVQVSINNILAAYFLRK